MRTFTDWRDERNKCFAIQAKCPLGLLENPDTEELNCWLSRFIVEARRKDTWWVVRTRTLYVLAALLSYGRSKSNFYPNLMDKNDPCFENIWHCVAEHLPKAVLVVQLNMQPLSLQTNILNFCSCTVTVSTPLYVCVILTVGVSLIFDRLSGFCRCYWLITCLVYTAWPQGNITYICLGGTFIYVTSGLQCVLHTELFSVYTLYVACHTKTQ